MPPALCLHHGNLPQIPDHECLPERFNTRTCLPSLPPVPVLPLHAGSSQLLDFDSTFLTKISLNCLSRKKKKVLSTVERIPQSCSSPSRVAGLDAASPSLPLCLSVCLSLSHTHTHACGEITLINWVLRERREYLLQEVNSEILTDLAQFKNSI